MPGRPPSQFEVNLNAIDDSLSSSKFRSIISNNISKSKLEEFSRKLNQLLFETAARDAAPRDHELQGGVEPGDDGDLAPRDLGPQDLAAQDPPTPSPATTPEATETGSNNTSSDQNSSTQSKGLAEQVVEILDNTEDCIDEKILIVNKLFHGLESEHRIALLYQFFLSLNTIQDQCDYLKMVGHFFNKTIYDQSVTLIKQSTSPQSKQFYIEYPFTKHLIYRNTPVLQPVV